MIEVASPQQHPFVTRPHATLWRLSVPVLFSLIAEPLTGLVDTYFVARLGVNALAALGVGTAALSSVFWIFNFLGIGTQTEIAQSSGRQGALRASKVVSLATTLAVLFGLAIIIIWWPLLGPTARFLGAAGEVEVAAVLYMRIRLFAAPALLMTLTGFGALRGRQDMRTPLYIAVTVNVLNMGLDAALIGPFGIVGAAWATVGAQWLGAVWVLWSMSRRFGFSADFNWRDAADLLKIGGDLFIRTGLLTGFLLLTTRVATRIGAESGAAHQAIRQVWTFTALGLDAIALTAQSLVGYFFGSRWISQAKRVAFWACVWGGVQGGLLSAALLLLAGRIALWLVPPPAWDAFFMAWVVAMIVQPINAVAFATDGIHWGTGDFRFLRNAMIAATVTAGGALLLIDEAAPTAFRWVWIVTGGWIVVRATLGVLRIWPGIGRSPFTQQDDPTHSAAA